MIPAHCLPETGVMVIGKDDRPKAVCFVAQAGGKIAMVGFLITDPELGPRDWLKSSRMALKSATEQAKAMLEGEGFIQIVTHSRAFHKLATQHCGYSDFKSPMLSAQMILDPGINPQSIN